NSSTRSAARAHHDSRRQKAKRVVRRAAPYRRDAHFMNMLMRADMDLPDRTIPPRTLCSRRYRDAVQEHDLAFNILAGIVGVCSRSEINHGSCKPPDRAGT